MEFGKKILCLLLLFLISNYSYAFEIKSANVAGYFYPKDTAKLSSKIDEFFNQVNPEPFKGNIFSLIVPHAGYEFSGKVAANAYKLIKDKKYSTVIVIGASHHFNFKGAAVYPEGEFQTPLGFVEIDSDFINQLISNKSDFVAETSYFEKEHSIEVQLPFLQKSLNNFKLVPILMGDCSFEQCQKIAEIIKKAIGWRKDILIVASSDMYHGYDWEESQKIDDVAIRYLKSMDEVGLFQALKNQEAQLCGGAPVVTTLIVSKKLKHNIIKLLEHTNSAFVTGNKEKGNWTVGYSAWVIDQPIKEVKMGLLNIEQRKKMLSLARKSIEHYLLTGDKLEVQEDDPQLKKEMGAFVTLHQNGQLRGCIGNLIGSKPLYLTIRDMAVEASVNDPRFPAVKPKDLKNIDIEISVLSPMEKIDSIEKIKLGEHGVLIRKGLRSGVFLPQVATETGWSKEEFLSQLCSQKAGLPADAWKDKTIEMYIFTAEIFSEKAE